MRSLVLYVGQFSEPEGNAAGKRVFGNALILEALGFDVLMLGKTQIKNSSGRINYSKHISFESFPNYGKLRYGKYALYLENYIKSLQIKPVCIIRYGSPGLSLFDNRVLRFAKKEDIKVIADVVDWLRADSGSLIFNIVKSLDIYLEKAVFNKKSDGIIAISNYLADYYKKRNKKVVVIPPVVAKYRINKAQNDVTRIIYAGIPFRLGSKKKDTHSLKDRLDLAIESLAEVFFDGSKPFSFSIFGITKEQYLFTFPRHEKLLEDVGDIIKFYGQRPMKEIQAELLESDFSILLREKNRATSAGFPTKVVESMSCGVPIITTRTSDLDKYIKNGINGFFVDINDSDSLVSQLKSIISISHDELQVIKNNCFEDTHFLPIAFENKMREFLDIVIGEKT